MNTEQFIQQLESLTKSDWDALINGKSLLMINDLTLETGDSNAANAIIKAPETETTVNQLKSDTIDAASDVLNNYYLTHPLTLEGFNYQANQLMNTHGVTAFTSTADNFPERTLFVDVGEVVAEARESPRHRYGVFLEIPGGLPEPDIKTLVGKWLKQGMAHEKYLGMNVCRYNC